MKSSIAIHPIILFRNSYCHHIKLDLPPATKLGFPTRTRAPWGLPVLLLSLLALLFLGCTPGRYNQPSTGWSTVSAIAVPVDSGSRLNEGATLTPLDNILTVSGGTLFTVGQVLLVDGEQMEITTVRIGELGVVRGANSTTPQTHEDRSTIYTLGDELLVLISTKQGKFKALVDEGSGSPKVKWESSQDGRKE